MVVVVVAVALAMALAVMATVVMVLVRWSMMINDAGDDDGRLMTTFVFPLQGRPAQSAHNPPWSHCSSTGAPEPIRRARRERPSVHHADLARLGAQGIWPTPACTTKKLLVRALYPHLMTL